MYTWSPRLATKERTAPSPPSWITCCAAFQPLKGCTYTKIPEVLATISRAPLAQTPHEYAHLKPSLGHERKDRAQPSVSDNVRPNHAQCTRLRGGGGGEGCRDTLGITRGWGHPFPVLENPPGVLRRLWGGVVGVDWCLRPLILWFYELLFLFVFFCFFLLPIFFSFSAHLMACVFVSCFRTQYVRHAKYFLWLAVFWPYNWYLCTGVNNQDGHWVRWVSTDGLTGLAWKHTHGFTGRMNRGRDCCHKIVYLVDFPARGTVIYVFLVLFWFTSDVGWHTIPQPVVRFPCVLRWT